MRRGGRALLLSLLAFVLLMGVMPAGASGAVTMTWERNWGTLDTTAPYADGSFYIPGDVAADKWGNVYVADGWSGPDRVQMFTADGVFVKKYDVPGTDPGDLSNPRSITTDRWGTIYVTQQGNNRIEVFNPTLYNHLRSISTPATPPWDCVGIAVGLDGTIYNSRQWTDVQVRDWLGNFITSIPLSHVMGVGISQDSELYVAIDSTGGDPQDLIGVYNPDLSLKWVWGGSGTAAGLFDRPWDIGIDGAANVFVVEWDNHRGQVLARNSDPLAMFGNTPPAEQQFVNPAGIGVGLDRTVYVADSGHSRISKWTVTTATETTQVAGTSRVATSIDASKRAYPDGAPFVIIATGYNWPDALGGAALAGAVGGPILLTEPDALPAAVATEINRLGASKAYILGGESAVSDDVYDAVEALAPVTAIERLGGGSRYETAILIARELKQARGSEYDGTAFVCTGANFPDALAAAPIAAANGWPIYLTPRDELRADVATALMEMWGGNPSNHGYIIGGEAALSAAVETALNSPPFVGYGRYSGGNRYETAAAVAQVGFDGMGMLYSRPAIATGENFPDALAGGVLQGSDYSVLLLTPKNYLHPATAAALAANKDMIYEVRFLGGTGAISTATRNAAKALLW